MDKGLESYNTLLQITVLLLHSSSPIFTILAQGKISHGASDFTSTMNCSYYVVFQNTLEGKSLLKVNLLRWSCWEQLSASA